MNRKISEDKIFSGKILNLRIDKVEIKGKIATREIIEHKDAVAVVAVDKEGYVYLVRQYRDAVGDYVLELPAGLVEKGEDYKDTALRELQEEIGFSSNNIKKLFEGYNSPGFCDEKTVIYIATDLYESKLQEDEDEEIDIVKIKIEDVRELLKSNRVNDFKTIIGLLSLATDF